MLEESLRQRWDKANRLQLIRERRVLPGGIINFCSNDYLDLSRDPRLIRALRAGAQKYGLGSGSSALIAGYHVVHAELEQRFAEFLQRDRAILFNSGYHANLGVITALANRDWQIFADRLCHASIIDAILLSRAQYHRYPHGDCGSLNLSLSRNGNKPALIISESIFSMEGDMAPVAELAKIAAKYRAVLMIDDAHGTGILGQFGRGICEFTGLRQAQVPVLVAPLGKAFGSLGAIVAGSHDLIENLVQFSRSYRYTTALPPAIAYATLRALKIIATETWRRERLNHLVTFFITAAAQRNIPLLTTQKTPIQAVLLRDNHRAVDMQKKLFTKGFAVAAIRPPTVPANTARLRISLTCAHTEKQIMGLLDLLRDLNDGQ